MRERRRVLRALGTVVPTSLMAICSSPAQATALNWDVGSGGVAGSGTWDTTTANWSIAAPTYVSAGTAPNTYTDGGVDDVTFAAGSANANATITLQAGGVNPKSTTISGTTTTGVNYTFAGGSFLGAGTFTILPPQNTGAVGPTTAFTVASPSWSGGLSLGNNANFGPVIESRVNGALGTGTITTRGTNGGGSFIRFTNVS